MEGRKRGEGESERKRKRGQKRREKKERGRQKVASSEEWQVEGKGGGQPSLYPLTTIKFT